MTTGSLVAFLLTALMARRKTRFRGMLDVAEVPRITEFVQAFAARYGLEAVVGRLEPASEETLRTLLQSRREVEEAEETADGGERELLVNSYTEDKQAVLEFRVGTGNGDELNLQHRLAWLGAPTGADRLDRETSLRLLRHFASSVRHQQFHNMDVLTLRVSANSPGGS